ncbi:hypothetical protein RLOC_00011505, partial [Lonchura striata]
MADRYLGLCRVFRGKKKKSPEAAPAQQHENPEQFQPLEDDAPLDCTEEKEPARGHDRKTLKVPAAIPTWAGPAVTAQPSTMPGALHGTSLASISFVLLQTFWKSPRIRRRKTGSAAAEGPAEPDSGLTELQAEPDVSPDSPECSENSDTSVTETWTKVLLPSVTEDVAITNTDSEETPGITNTATSLDPAEPSEDSEAARNDQRANADMALTEDVDMTNAKTRHTQGIANTDTMPTPSPTLSQDLIFDYFKDPCVSSQPLQHSGEEGKHFFEILGEVVPLDNAPSLPHASSRCQPRELCHVLVPFCSRTAFCLLRPHSRAEPCWDLPVLAFLVEVSLLASAASQLSALSQPQLPGTVPTPCAAAWAPPCAVLGSCRPGPLSLPCAFQVLGCLDLRECGDSLLEIMSRHLWSECRERRRLALRGLVVLTKDPSMVRRRQQLKLRWAKQPLGLAGLQELRQLLPALLPHLPHTALYSAQARRMHPLSPRLLELLGDANAEVVSMSLCVFTNVLQHKGILVSSTTTPKLAEALLLLFDHDSSNVHLISIQLFDKMMHLVVDEGKKPLKKILCQSLLPLFLYCHEENRRVAKASRETLLGVAEFLKKRNLRKLLKNEQLSQFAECL